MRHSAFIALFASAILAQNTPSAGAQNSATVLNLFNDVTQLSILTVLGSDASATTYQNSCPSDAAGVSAVPSDQRMCQQQALKNTILTIPSDGQPDPNRR
jgi:hypothetical protein